jgi:hypothetical protein
MKTARLALILIAAMILTAAPAPSAHEEFGFVGTLVTVDLAKNRIAVKFKENGKDETVRIALTPKTEVTKDKKPVPRSTLKAGLSVAVRALGDDDTNLEALTIRIVPPMK